jgi:hypothetical protein
MVPGAVRGLLPQEVRDGSRATAAVFIRPLTKHEEHELARIVRRGARTTSSVKVWSWLNRIECQFGVMLKLLIAGSDYADHEQFRRAASAFLRRRNREARRDFEQRQ